MTPDLAAQACLQAARFVEGWIAGTADITYTPDGLAWSSQWGSLRYTMNAAFIAEVFSAHIAGEAGGRASGTPQPAPAPHEPCACQTLRHELVGWFRHIILHQTQALAAHLSWSLSIMPLLVPPHQKPGVCPHERCPAQS